MVLLEKVDEEALKAAGLARGPKSQKTDKAAVSKASVSTAVPPKKAAAPQPPPLASGEIMDMEEEAAVEVARQQSRKPSGGVAKEQRQLQTLMLKQILRSAQTNRELEGVVFDTYLGQAGDLTAKMLEQGKNYNDQVALAGRGHKLDPPHVYVFAGLLEALKGLGESVGQATAKQITELHSRMTALPWQEVAETVQFCRLSKTYKADTMRITLSFAPSADGLALKALVARALQEKEWERRFGRAPRSHLERELQGFLERLLKEK